jgi:hypothetical protein
MSGRMKEWMKNPRKRKRGRQKENEARKAKQKFEGAERIT